MMLLLVLALLFGPVCVGADAPPESLVGALATSAVIDRIRAEILRRMRRKRQAALWKATGFGQRPAKVAKVATIAATAQASTTCGQASANDAAAANTPPVQATTVQATTAARHSKRNMPPVDPDARDPDLPWRNEWLDEDDFKRCIFVEDGYVHCRACIDGNKNTNLGISPDGKWRGKPVSDAWNHGQLVQHCNSEKHKLAIKQCEEDRAAAEALHRGRCKMLASLRSSLNCVIRLVYWLCIENIAMRKLASLFNMLRNLPEIPSSLKQSGDNYINAARCREFVMALSGTLKERLWKDVKASPFVSVMIDESTDISSSENLIIYLVYLKAGRACVAYVQLLHAPAVDAEAITESLLSFFVENGLAASKIVCFCSDGAFVMTGCKNGVGVRLQRVNPFMQCVHCIAHRLALCCADSADDLDYPDMAENVVNELSSLFNRSSKKTHQVAGIAKELGIKRTRIVKSGKTRWLSRSTCVDVLLQLLGALVSFLGSTPEDLTAQSLHTAITAYTFVGILCGMVDLLALLAMLSQTFQGDILDYSIVRARLEQVRSVIIDEFISRDSKDGEPFSPDMSKEEWDKVWNRILDEQGAEFILDPSSDHVSEFLATQAEAEEAGAGHTLFRGIKLHSQDRPGFRAWLIKFAVAVMSRLAERFPAMDMAFWKH